MTILADVVEIAFMSGLSFIGWYTWNIRGKGYVRSSWMRRKK